MKSRLFLPWSLLVGLFFLTSNAEAARATTLILGKSKPEPKIDTPPTAEEENVSISVPATSNLSNETINVGNVTKLTGVPQIDYIYDPNLPRELNGYNLTDYPFYNSVPEDIDFKCDGLHDGFYASVPHKCQVYHHCLFGTRYDFLCANYTAFDQKTFICHFASEVDCKNSPRYFNRNEALYKATTTTTVSPFGFSGLSARRPGSDSTGGRRRRPYRRRKPSYEYYDEYEDLAEDDYYDEASSRRRKRPRPLGGRESYDDAEEEGSEADKPLPPSGPNKSVFDRPRIAPKIRRPVPVNEREKYDYSSDSRAIVKELAVEKKRFENVENANRKQINSKQADYYETTGNENSKNKEPVIERVREREHKGDAYEFDRNREREKDKERERDRDRERERDERPYRRPPKKRRRPDGLDDEYDEYDDVRRYRNRNRPRYEEYGDYEYDERPYRRNRDQEYQPRDHDYDRDRPYRSRESDYDRPRNRDRIRDDGRPLRNRDIDDRPVRNRDDERPPLRSRDEDRPIRNRDSDKSNPKDQEDRLTRSRNEQLYRNDGKGNKSRIREDERYYNSGDEEYKGKSTDESKRNKEMYRDELIGERKEEADKPYKYKDEDEDEDNYREQNRNQERPPRFRDNLDKFGKGRIPSRNETEETKIKIPDGSYSNGRLRPREQTERPFRNNGLLPARFGNNQRPRLPQSSLDGETSSEEQSEPVPASRPAYITKPTEAPLRKPFSGQNGRKTNDFKRPLLQRVPSVFEDSSEQQDKTEPDLSIGQPPIQTTDRYQEKPYERPNYEVSKEQQPLKYFPPEDIRTIELLNEKLQPIKTDDQPQAELNQPKLKVPHEDSVPKEELAPKAPKFPQSSPRRRPFLPSRNGNPTFPRNLLPVGVKALQTPRGFQVQNKKPEEDEPKTTTYSEKEPQEPRYPFQTNTKGLEFRTKVSTAIGVDQPKLTQFFQDVQSSRELELPEYENSQNASPSVADADYYSNEPSKEEEERPSGQEPRPFPVAAQRQLNNPTTQDLSSSYIIPEYSSGQTYRQDNSNQYRQDNSNQYRQDNSHQYRQDNSNQYRQDNNNQYRQDNNNQYRQENNNQYRQDNSHQYRQDNNNQYRQDNNPSINFRPTLKPTDFPQLNVPDAPSSQHAQPQENRNLEQAFKNRPLPSAINQQLNPQFSTKSPVIFSQTAPKQASSQPQSQPQLSPQSFYSENPKFQTTIKVPELMHFKPTPGLTSFNTGTHLPIFQGGIRQNLPNPKPEPVRYENSQRQIDVQQENFKPLLKFPSQNENLDDTNEFDVSLNDALQPISTLHPRNVPTGVFLSNWQRNQQQPGGFKRRVFQVGSPGRQQINSQEYNNRKQELPPRVVNESRNVPNQPKNPKFNTQRQASSNVYQRYAQPPVYHPVRPVTNTGKYFTIITQ